MSLTVKIVLWLFLGTFALTAHAHELSEGTGIVCDTPDQVQRFAVLGAKPEAIKTINDGAAKAVHGEFVITLRLASGIDRGNGAAKRSDQGRHGRAAVLGHSEF